MVIGLHYGDTQYQEGPLDELTVNGIPQDLSASTFDINQANPGSVALLVFPGHLVGDNVIVASFVGSAEAWLTCYEVEDLDQSTPIRPESIRRSYGSQSGQTAMVLNVPSDPADLVVDVLASNSMQYFAGPGQTEVVNNNASDWQGASFEAGASLVEMSWTRSLTVGIWASHIAASLQSPQNTGPAPIEATGTSILPALEAGVTVAVEVEATGGGLLPSLGATGSVAVEIEAAGAGILPELTGGGSAAVEVTAVGVSLLPELEGGGAVGVEIEAQGVGLLPELEGGGAVGVEIEAQGVGLLPELEATGSVSTTPATGAQGGGLLPEIEATGTASIEIEALAGAVLPELQGGGSALIPIEALGQAILPALESGGQVRVWILASGGEGLLPELLSTASVFVGDPEVALVVIQRPLVFTTEVQRPLKLTPEITRPLRFR